MSFSLTRIGFRGVMPNGHERTYEIAINTSDLSKAEKNEFIRWLYDTTYTQHKIAPGVVKGIIYRSRKQYENSLKRHGIEITDVIWIEVSYERIFGKVPRRVKFLPSRTWL